MTSEDSRNRNQRCCRNKTKVFLPEVETPPDFKLGSLVEDHLLGRADYRLKLVYPLYFTLSCVIEDAVNTWFLIRQNFSFIRLHGFVYAAGHHVANKKRA